MLWLNAAAKMPEPFTAGKATPVIREGIRRAVRFLPRSQQRHKNKRPPPQNEGTGAVELLLERETSVRSIAVAIKKRYLRSYC